MNRRRYLGITVGSTVGVAGCVGAGGDQSGQTVNSFPNVSANADPVPDRHDAEIDLETVDQFSESAPASVRITYTNTATSKREVQFTTSAPFPPYTGQAADGDGQLSIIPKSRENIDPRPKPADDMDDPFIPLQPQDGCWRAQAMVAGNDVAVTRTLDSDESVGETYVLMAHLKSSSCLAIGDYRFNAPHYFEKDSAWGFDISLDQ